MTENVALKIDHGVPSEDQEAVDERVISAILKKHDGARGGLIAILEEIQARYGYLPETALRIVAENTGRSLVDIYSVATFYSSFSLKPRGRHVVCACLGTACHVRGAPRVVDAFEGRLGVSAGETTPDKEFTLETVNCLGACALGPVVIIDGHYFSKVKKTDVRQLINDSLTGFADIGGGDDKLKFPIELNCPRCNRSLMDNDHRLDGQPAIRLTVAAGNRHGRVRLSSLYGSDNRLNEHDIPLGTAVDFLCPHCHGRLTGNEECVLCGAPMAAMMVNGGGAFRICSRLGCRGRMLDMA